MPQIIRNTFEGIEGIAKSTVSQVKKLPMEMMRDAIASLTGNESSQQRTVNGQQQTEIKRDEERNIAETRRRLAEITAQLRQAKQDKPQEAPKEVKEQKKMVEKKKKESVLAKLIKSKQGSKEAMQRASG